MVDIEVVAQLVESMESSVNQLEQAIAKKNFDDANKLRTFIFDLHLQINSAITGKK
jgi:HPt (histidine-containing phosphotransfer) domain-containing protein